MSIKLNIITRPLINEIEQYIIKKINKNPPTIFAPITNKELDKIKETTIEKFPNNSDQISKNLIRSIKSSYTKNHMINNHYKLIKNSNKIISDYTNGKNVLEISGKFDISPLNILREVFLSKYKTKLIKIIMNPDILSNHDKEQLSIAIENDDYALVDGTEVMKESAEFEKQVENFLKKNSIKYITQEELTKEQIKTHGQPVNTPDFLIKSDLYIGNSKINWIDAKNFYGSNIPFVKNKIKKQTFKYLNKWGPGSIIFSLGFNKNLDFSNILFLNFQDLTNK
jgi:hypothetical protein